LAFTWSPPETGAPITNYLLEVGTASGTYPYTFMLGPVTSFTVSGGGGGSGDLYFRVTAINTLGSGTPSEEAGVHLGGPATPSAPRNVNASATNGVITIAWSPPTFGAPIASYYIQLGTVPGVYTASGLIGPATSLTLPGFSDGLYYFRVTAVNAYGPGVPSGEVMVYTGPPCTVPGPPQLSGTATGTTATLSWTTPAGGPLIGYSVLLRTQPGGPETTVAQLGLVNTISGQASSGTYYLRVRAHALCGPGAGSNEVQIAVP